MYRTYSDLRILRLALHMEETFERYEEYLRDLIPEAVVRAKIAGLFRDGPAHRALRKTHEALARTAHAGLDTLTTEEILQTLRDCEEWAADFYEHQLDRVSDPKLVELFTKLAREEDVHVTLVDEARDLLAAFRSNDAAPPIRPNV